MTSFCQCHGEDLDAHIDEVVAQAPPLTPAQKVRLGVIFRNAR